LGGRETAIARLCSREVAPKLIGGKKFSDTPSRGFTSTGNSMSRRSAKKKEARFFPFDLGEGSPKENLVTLAAASKGVLSSVRKGRKGVEKKRKEGPKWEKSLEE